MRRSISPILLKFQKQFPQGTAAELAVRTGASTRHCERVLAGGCALGERFLIKLLRSDFGQVAYMALMDGCEQPWFARLRKQFDISQLRQMMAQAKRGLEALEAAE